MLNPWKTGLDSLEEPESKESLKFTDGYAVEFISHNSMIFPWSPTIGLPWLSTTVCPVAESMTSRERVAEDVVSDSMVKTP